MGNNFLSIAQAVISRCSNRGIRFSCVSDADDPMVQLLHGNDNPVEGRFLLAKVPVDPEVSTGTVAWNVLFRPSAGRATPNRANIIIASAKGVVFYRMEENLNASCSESTPFIRTLWYMEAWRSEPNWFGNGQGNSKLDVAINSDPMAVVKQVVVFLNNYLGCPQDYLGPPLSPKFYSVPDAQAVVLSLGGKLVVVRTLCHQERNARLTRIGSITIQKDLGNKDENPTLPGVGLNPEMAYGPFLTWDSLENALRQLLTLLR